MSHSAKILVVDDIERNAKLLADVLEQQGYAIAIAASGPAALMLVETWQADLLLLDIVMPGMDGYEVCQRIRNNPATAILPVIMITALDPSAERIKGLEAGADDFLSKPVNLGELLARVRSLLRVKTLFDTVQAQKAELENWSKTLEQRVRLQVDELERLARLRRFLSPQVADWVMSTGEQSSLYSHRQQIVAVFCDLRGFTAFSETHEPEETIGILQTYHKLMGHLISQFEGMIDHRAGDGVMVIFNDPAPCPEPALRAIQMADAMRRHMLELAEQWSKWGYELGFGVGMAMGYATLGLVGDEDRFDYTANGSVVNLASRLCDEAIDGQILVSQRLYAEVVERVVAKFIANLSLKGFYHSVPAYNIIELRTEHND